ncbi:MAG: hypothetical protein KA712_20965 [Myxococcales bacterium]|nr:hypothetical protein [Myxococcales bacterium]
MPTERAIAPTDGARLLDQGGIAYLKNLPTVTLIVFRCHHGVRSRNAAIQCAVLGFTNVCNLIGGIESWALDVDPSVARYESHHCDTSARMSPFAPERAGFRGAASFWT